MAKVTEIRCGQACNKLNNTGLPYGWDMNIYRGCQHACVYCYAIYSHEYISKGSYYEDIYVKVNIAEQLERQLSSPSWKGEEIGIGGVTDSYQPIEAKYKLMPEILKVLIKYKNPCSISTKSDLILRDYDLIDELSRVADVSVSASVNIMDEEVRKKIEPGAKSATRRFNMLKEFSKTNAFTGVLQMPVIPYISDSRENIEELYASAADSNVDYLVRGVMYLRGKTRGVFFDFIRREYPELLEKLTLLYRNYELRGAYKNSLYLMMNELKSKYCLSGNYLNPRKKRQTEEKSKGDEYQQLSLFEERESDKMQGSVLIPSKESIGDGQTATLNSQKKREKEWDLNPFVELEIGEGEVGRGETYQSEAVQKDTSKNETAQEDEIQAAQIRIELGKETKGNLYAREGQPIEFVMDEKRAKFYSMRQIARENMSFYTDQAKIFYEQGLFMKDFEDDYEGVASFVVHYPYYQRMGVEQLRTYFTWRTKVRRGDITSVPSSYAFLYMYELLNQIGVKSPEEGLEKLMTFWQEFREIDSVVDKYVLRWLKDYHIYYPLPQSFSEFAVANQLILEYPTIFAYDSDEENSFELFVEISKYRIKESVFYTEENVEIISKCFYFILEKFRDAFRQGNGCFEDLIFYLQREELNWSPFRRALFYPMLPHLNRQLVISEKEVYTCTEEGWVYTGVALLEQGRRLMGYIMREMECCLRKVTKFKHKLTANPEGCSEESIATLKEKGIVFPETIEEWVMEFYRMYTRIEVKVDAHNLHEIRKQAMETQEKLIVEEDNVRKADEVQEDNNRKEDGMQGNSKQFSIIPRQEEEYNQEKKGINSQDERVESIHQEEKTEDDNPWDVFKKSLTEIEEEALKLLLEGKSIDSLGMERGIMPEVLIDGINEKAMDFVGDTLLEIDETVSIYEDYLEHLSDLIDSE